MVEHLLAGVSLPPRTGVLGADLRAIAEAFRVRALLHPDPPAQLLRRPRPGRGAVGRTAVGGMPVEEAVTLLREVQAGPTLGTSD
ncbi:hypothetical protein [Streptomyces sp. NPDC090083]|uniref:hypothetical protein n=1 Tax=Streptomyces sp. NPDC090083 TaxID=3365941 RepID=UPI00381BC284